MSRDISLFAGYHSGENTVTNYCGLMLKMIYEENPKNFEIVLDKLIPDDERILIGPQFAQQRKKKNSIPDLSITQKSFSIFFETKLKDWFYDEQIISHIESFNPKTENKVLFLLSNFEEDNPEAKYENSIKQIKDKGIIIKSITFEKLANTFDEVCKSEVMANMLEEFNEYLDRNDLLPKWKYLLDVASCRNSYDQVIENNAYICPAGGGQRKHRRAKYLAPYKDKKVEYIYTVRANVIVDINKTHAKVEWNNSGEKKEVLINAAKNLIDSIKGRTEENMKVPLQVFLLKDGQKTMFQKGSKGGLYGSKTYFWDIALGCKSSSELAEKCKDKNWEDFQIPSQ